MIRFEYCEHCKRVVKFVLVSGEWRCERCGRPSVNGG